MPKNDEISISGATPIETAVDEKHQNAVDKPNTADTPTIAPAGSKKNHEHEGDDQEENANKKQKKPVINGMVDLLTQTSEAVSKQAIKGIKPAYENSPIAQDIVRLAKGAAELTGIPLMAQAAASAADTANTSRKHMSVAAGDARKAVIGDVQKATGEMTREVGVVMSKALDSTGMPQKAAALKAKFAAATSREKTTAPIADSEATNPMQPKNN